MALLADAGCAPRDRNVLDVQRMDPPGLNAALEWLRAVSCVGIVWFHSGAPGASVGYGGLVAFMMLSVALGVSSKRRDPLRTILRKRLHRMGLPWLFWSSVYGVAKLAEALIEGKPFSEEFKWTMLLSGTSTHLWYLPFGCVVTVAGSFCVSQGWLGPRRHSFFWGLGLGVLSFFASSLLLPSLSGLIPVAQWTFIFPAVFLGLALGSRVPGSAGNSPVAAAAIVAIAFAAWTLHAVNSATLNIPYISGVTACSIAWVLPGQARGLGLLLGRLSFGVYLIHPLVAAILLRVFPALGSSSTAILVAILSFLSALVLRRTVIAAFF